MSRLNLSHTAGRLKAEKDTQEWVESVQSELYPRINPHACPYCASRCPHCGQFVPYPTKPKVTYDDFRITC